jgi:anti-sigma factor RsiW
MSVPIHPVTESDLLAFVDGRLQPRRRDEVADHLAQCPRDAHRIAADLALLEGLRMLFGRRAQPPVAKAAPTGWAWPVRLMAAALLMAPHF